MSKWTRRLQTRCAGRRTLPCASPSRAVRKGEADACVSSGNTGALMATARYVLKTLPALTVPPSSLPCRAMAAIPSCWTWAPTSVCTAQHLAAVCDHGYRSCGRHARYPGCAGCAAQHRARDIKGDDLVREAAELLSHSTLNYVGIIEGDGIFNGKADVVCATGSWATWR